MHLRHPARRFARTPWRRNRRSFNTQTAGVLLVCESGARNEEREDDGCDEHETHHGSASFDSWSRNQLSMLIGPYGTLAYLNCFLRHACSSRKDGCHSYSFLVPLSATKSV